jgi:hypothetical protein
MWVTFFEHIAGYDQLYRALLGSKGSPWFARKMRASLADMLRELEHLPHGPNASARPTHTVSDALVPDLVATMFVEAITWWLEQSRPYTPREIAMRTALLAAAVFKEASTLAMSVCVGENQVGAIALAFALPPPILQPPAAHDLEDMAHPAPLDHCRLSCRIQLHVRELPIPTRRSTLPQPV